MSPPIRVGIVGAGYISAAYLKAAQNFPQLAMVSCADALQANAEKRGEEFRLKVQSFPSLGEVLPSECSELALEKAKDFR